MPRTKAETTPRRKKEAGVPSRGTASRLAAREAAVEAVAADATAAPDAVMAAEPLLPADSAPPAWFAEASATDLPIADSAMLSLTDMESTGGSLGAPAIALEAGLAADLPALAPDAELPLLADATVASDASHNGEPLALVADAADIAPASDATSALPLLDEPARILDPAQAEAQWAATFADDDLAAAIPPAYQLAALTPRRNGRPFLLTASIALVAVLAAIGGAAIPQLIQPATAANDRVASLSSDASRLRGEIGAINADLSALTAAVRVIGADVNGLGTAFAAADDNAKIRLAELAGRLQQAEAVEAERIAAIAELTQRVEANERAAAEQTQQVAALATSIGGLRPAIDPTVTAAIPRQTNAAARPSVLDGWVVLDVNRGRALVDGRGFGMFDIGIGQQLPGLGAVQRIEQQNGRWVVVTAAGLIQQLQRPF